MSGSLPFMFNMRFSGNNKYQYLDILFSPSEHAKAERFGGKSHNSISQVINRLIDKLILSFWDYQITQKYSVSLCLFVCCVNPMSILKKKTDLISPILGFILIEAAN